MALIGSRWGIVSVGLSCQTSRQIRRNKGRLERLLDDEFVLGSGPFDWVIAGADRVAAALERGLPFPPDRADIDFASFRPLWTDGGIYYWHDLRGAAGRASFDETASKYRHKTDNLDRALACERVIAVLSNTQNNLPWMSANAPLFHPFIARASVLRIRDALRARATGQVDIMLMSYADRVEDLTSEEGIHQFAVQPDETEWGGDNVQWANGFKTLCARLAPNRRQNASKPDVAAQRRSS